MQIRLLTDEELVERVEWLRRSIRTSRLDPMLKQHVRELGLITEIQEYRKAYGALGCDWLEG